MDFFVKEADIVRLLLGYLKHNGCYESISSLVLESNVTLENLGNNTAYLQRLVLQGRWDAVERALDAMKPDLSPHVTMQLYFFMKRQKYLELLSWQSGGVQRMAFPPWKPLKLELSLAESDGTVEMASLLQHLNTLKGLCSVSEFNSLCAFLTLEKLEDHPDYQNWTVAQGRWNCSTLMVNLLSPLLTERNDHSPTTSEQLENGLIKTVAMSLAYQQALATDKPFDSNQTHQRAVLSSETGYIVPDGSAFVGGADISANLVLQSPVAFRRQFDEAFAVPQVARAVQNSPLGNNASAATHALGGSPQQHGLRTNDGLITVQQGQQSTAHHHASPPPRQQETAMHDVGPPLYAVAPQQHGSAAAPLYPPAQPYAQQSAAAGQNVFAFAPPGGSSYITVPDEVPQSTYPAQSYTNSAPAVAPQYAAPYAPPHATLSQPMRGQQDAQAPLSIEVADGTQIPTGFSAFPSGAAPVSAIYAPSSQQYAGFQAVPVSYGSFTPNEHSGIRSAAAGMPSGGGSTSQFANQHTSQFANQNPPINPILAGQPTRDNYGIGNMAPPFHPAAPSSVRSVNARPPLAWTVEDEQPTTAAATAGPSTARQEPASKVIHVASVPVSEAPPPAAFVVGEPEEVKVKPMPAALRRKMLADQEAAAAAEEERQRMQAENLAAERASSRGRSRSAPRGAAVGANNHANVSFTSQASAGPPSSSRPVSAVRTRGVLKNNDPVQGGGGGMPLENVVVMKERSGSANNAVRRSHDKVNTEPVARPPSAGSQTSAKRESARPPAAGDIKPPSDRSNAQPSATVPGTVYNNKNLNNDNSSFNNSPYVPHVLFESKCPLRCAAVLSSGPERTHLAVGSNAKSIYTLSYSNEAMRPRNLRPGQDATSMVQLEGELQAVHNGSVYCMDWHSNMGLLVSGSNDKALRISNPSSGRISEPMKEHNGTIRVVKFLQSYASGSGSGSSSALVASAGAGDCKPRLWDAQKGALVRSLSEHPESVHGLVWVNDHILVTGCDDGCVIGHDLRSARPAWSYNLNDHLQNDSSSRTGLCCLALLRSPFAGAADGFASPYNVPMIAGSVGGFVTIFNAVNGQVHSHNQLHQNDVRSITLLSASSRPNGAQNFDVLTGSYDHTAAVWNISSDSANKITFGPQPLMLRGHTDKVLNAVSFSAPDRSTPQVVTTGADGKVIYWNQKIS